MMIQDKAVQMAVALETLGFTSKVAQGRTPGTWVIEYLDGLCTETVFVLYPDGRRTQTSHQGGSYELPNWRAP